MGPLEIIMEGNRRYVSRISKPSNKNPEHSSEEVGERRPFAAVITCVDSPVPPKFFLIVVQEN